MAAGAAAAAPSQAGFTLALRPTRVFKTADRSHEDTESWIFSLLVQSPTPAKLEPAAMTVELLSAGQRVRVSRYPAEGLKPLTYRTAFPPRLPDGRAPERPFFWPFVVRMRFTEPRGLKVDAMRIEVEGSDPTGRRSRSRLVLPVETYVQKTALVFPFRGKGIVLQGGATNGGHRNRSGAFAIDAMGLDDVWSVVRGAGKSNTDYPGFGRELIAPAAGVVARARADRPDQPVGDQSDPKYYAAEYPGGGDPGNHLIIDHGAGEFSMLAHFQAGSMLVKAGDRVAQGQPLGRLGHSGDTTAPHLHYQLQAGPDWEYADALPYRFTNVDAAILDRGTYFETA
jgi:murein DD-endopeptidase MepM/ murein hydrolase activator NlpD